MRARALLALGLLLGAPAQAQMLTYSNGTGFFIQRDGTVLTNYHVIEHCKDYVLQGAVPQAKATLLAVDMERDLALLKSEALPFATAKLNSEKQPLRRGDPVVITGYPGQSWQVGEPVTREANILDTIGPQGQEHWLQFSDALQEGNSGGPLLDGAGHVVGVVVAKGKLVRHDHSTGMRETVEEFDLAISLPAVRRFLSDNNVLFEEADSGIRHSARRIEDDARQFIVNVRCKVEP